MATLTEKEKRTLKRRGGTQAAKRITKKKAPPYGETPKPKKPAAKKPAAKKPAAKKPRSNGLDTLSPAQMRAARSLVNATPKKKKGAAEFTAAEMKAINQLIG